MKVCSTCRSTFPDGFGYCPYDTGRLLPEDTEGTAAQEDQAVALAVAALSVNNRLRIKSAEQKTAFRPNRQSNDICPSDGEQVSGFEVPISSIDRPSALTHNSDIGFLIPEPAILPARLGAAVWQFFKELKEHTPPGSSEDPDGSLFLLGSESLPRRLGREIAAAAIDLRRNPRHFLVTILSGERSSRQRRQWLQAGAAIAVIIYSLVVSASLIAPRFNTRKAGREAERENPIEVTHLMSPGDVNVMAKRPLPEIPKGKGGFTGGSKPKIEQAHGGGGGGRRQPLPPSKGVPPPMALAPQIVLPNPEPPKIKTPVLPVPMTVYGDPKALPELKGPIGDSRGIEGPPSSGPGKGAGIGTGEGTGVGPGEGGGVGPGRGGNAGGGDFALGGGKGPGGSGGIEVAGTNGVGIPVILYKEKAKYTEAARHNKIQGLVVLNAVFTADGRILNIRIVRGLPDGLTESAIEAAKKVRFQPATKNGAPVSVRIRLEFSFALY